MLIGFDFNFWQNLHYNNIFILALELLLCGGWLFILWQFWAPFKELWINWRQEIFAGQNPQALMEIKIPANNERNIEAIEQFFAQIHGLRRSFTLWEKWWKGQFVLTVSLEIVSFEGYIRFFIRSPYKLRHLIEHALYAQYPEAELTILRDEEDFKHFFPNKMPDAEFDMLGTEYVNQRYCRYPIRTYKEYEKSHTGEYLDPLRHLLELMSNLKEGEYVWYQLIIVPEYEKWALSQTHEVDKLLGKQVKKDPENKSIIMLIGGHLFSMLRAILLAPLSLLRELYRQLFVGTGKILLSQIKDNTYEEPGRQLKGIGKEFKDQIFCLHEAFLSQFRKKPSTSSQKQDKQDIIIENYIDIGQPALNVNAPALQFPSDYPFRSYKQKQVIDAMERKLSQNIYKTCIRVLYFAKKPVFSKFRFWSEIHGTFRHFSDNDYNSLVRGTYSKTTADYFFAKARKKRRQNAIITNTKARDWYAGDQWNYFSCEELASLWHLPLSKDLLANCSTVKGIVKPPPPSERVRAGYKKEKLLDGIDDKAVPDNLPVTEFEPYNYQ